MKISTIREDRLEDLLRLLNRAFEDYLVPLSLDIDQLRFLIKVEDVQIDLSSWILDGDRPVGFSLVGLRSNLGRIGPFGLDPGFRTQGLGTRLLRHSLTILAEAEAESVELEVIRDNLPAFKLYESNGFFVKRELLSYRYPVDPPAGVADPGIVAISGEALLGRFAQYHSTPPCWQRSAASLAHRLEQCEALGLGNPHEPRAYLILDGDRIHDAYWEPGIDRNALESFLAHVASKRGRLTLINVPADDSMAHSLESMGWECFLRQYEMRYDISEVA